MPAITDDGEDDLLPIPTDPGPPIIASPDLKDVVIDTRYEPSAGLLTNIEGTPWTVDYYQQVLGKDSAVSGQQFNRDSVYQQYTNIKDMEFRVSTPLTSTQDDQSNSMRLTGAALVYPFVIPNVGNMFIAAIGDGHDGIFQITRVERKSIFREACYSIEYNLIDRVDEKLLADLKTKTIKTYYFIRDYLVNHQNPLVTEDEFGLVRKLSVVSEQLTNLFFNQFVSKKLGTIIVPEQPVPTYDYALTNFMTTNFTLRDFSAMRDIRAFNVDGPLETSGTNFWNALANRDEFSISSMLNPEYGLLQITKFNVNSFMCGIRYSGMERVVASKLGTYNVDQGDKVGSYLMSSINITNSDSALVDKIIPTLSVDYYLFPETFYKFLPYEMSLLEVELTSFFKIKRMSSANLTTIALSASKWTPLECFYYLPILIYLIKSHIRSF